jgi:c-di-GMP-binding flagellar brake protein YcgR
LPTATRPTNEVLTVLETACARNAPLEIHATQADHRTVVFRSRAIQLDTAGGRLLIDKPAATNGSGSLSLNALVSVYVQLDARRLEFRTTLTELAVTVQLNAEMRVRGAAMLLPDAIREGQRREHFRLAIAGATLTARVVPLAEVEAFACPVKGPVVRCDITNVSIGGLLITAPAELADYLKPQGKLFVLLPLDIDNKPVEVNALCEVRHVMKLQERLTNRVGLAFVTWPGTDPTLMQRTLTRYIVELERKMLRRRK